MTRLRRPPFRIDFSKLERDCMSNPVYDKWIRVRLDCCPEWKDWETFAKDVSPGYGEKKLFVKVRKNEPFSPDNARWVFRSYQRKDFDPYRKKRKYVRNSKNNG